MTVLSNRKGSSAPAGPVTQPSNGPSADVGAGCRGASPPSATTTCATVLPRDSNVTV
jgi:hypothetical protein